MKPTASLSDENQLQDGGQDTIDDISIKTIENDGQEDSMVVFFL